MDLNKTYLIGRMKPWDFIPFSFHNFPSTLSRENLRSMLSFMADSLAYYSEAGRRVRRDLFNKSRITEIVFFKGDELICWVIFRIPNPFMSLNLWSRESSLWFLHREGEHFYVHEFEYKFDKRLRSSWTQKWKRFFRRWKLKSAAGCIGISWEAKAFQNFPPSSSFSARIFLKQTVFCSQFNYN